MAQLLSYAPIAVVMLIAALCGSLTINLLQWRRIRSAKPPAVSNIHNAIAARQGDFLLSQLHSLVWDQISEGLQITDLNGVDIDCNSAALSSIGYQRAGVIGKDSYLIVEEDGGTLAAILNARRECDQRGHGSFRMRVKHAAGHTLPFEVALRPLKDAAGRLVARLSISRNIAHELEVESAKGIRDAVWSQIPYGITIVGTDRRIIDCNQTAAELLGISIEAAVGRKSSELLSTTLTDAAINDILFRADSDGAASEIIECKLPAGDIKRVLWTVKPIRNEKGDVAARMYVSRDLTDQEEDAEKWILHNEIWEQTTDGLVVMSTHGIIVGANPGMSTIWGYTAAEVVGVDPIEAGMVVPFDPRVGAEVVNQVRREGKGQTTTQVRHKSGRLIDVENRFVALKKNGVFDGRYLLIVRDITQQRKIEEERKLRDLVWEQISDGITVVDPNGKILSCNNAVEEIMELSAGDIIGRTAAELSSNPKQFEDTHALRHEADEKGVANVVRSLLSRNGQARRISSRIYPLRDDSGAVTARVVFTRDTTEEEKLKETNRLAQLIWEHGKAGILVFNSERRIVGINQTACDFIGYSIDEMVGHFGTEFSWQPDEFERTGVSVKMALQHGHATGTFRVRHKSGRMVHLDATLHALVDPADGTTKVISFVSDVTDTIEERFQTNLLASALDQIQDGAAIIGADGTIAGFNAAWFARMRHNHAGARSRRDLIGHNIADLIHSDHKSDIINRINAAAQGQEYAGFSAFTQSDGSSVHLAVNYSQFIDTQSDWRGCIFVQRDVSALRKSEDKYRTLISNIEGIVWEADITQNRNVYVSPQSRRILGYNPEEWVANPTFWSDHLHPDDRESAVAYSRTSIERGDDYEVEYRMIAADGRAVWVRDHVTTETDSQGRKWARGIMIDITERRNMQKKLLSSQARFSDLVMAAMDAIVSIDADSKIVVFNAAAERLFGYTLDEVQGEPLEMLLPNLSRRQHPGLVRKFAKSATMRRGMGASREIRGLRKTGEEIPIEVSISQVGQGPDKMLTAIIRDVSDRNLMQRQVRQMEKMQAVGQLAGGVAHDFNNILAIILGNAELALDDAVTRPSLRTQLNRIISSSKLGADLVTRLLAFSRGSSGATEVVELSALFARLMPLIRPLIGPNITINANAALTCWPIAANPSELETALMNLVINARDAMPDGGAIMIEAFNVPRYLIVDDDGTHAERQMVEIVISDQGIGMEEDVRRRAFEPFFSTKPLGKGTGLGLPMVYGFARSLGGSVEIKSQVGDGTSIHLFIPRTGESPVESVANEQLQLQAAPSGCVLVLDDNDALRETICEQLDELSLKVFDAPTTAAATQLFERYPAIDTLLFDYKLAEKATGLELAKTLSDQRPGLRVVIMSGFIDIKENVETMLKPDWILLSKPAKIEDIKAALTAPRRTSTD